MAGTLLAGAILVATRALAEPAIDAPRQCADINPAALSFLSPQPGQPLAAGAEYVFAVPHVEGATAYRWTVLQQGVTVANAEEPWDGRASLWRSIWETFLRTQTTRGGHAGAPPRIGGAAARPVPGTAEPTGSAASDRPALPIEDAPGRARVPATAAPLVVRYVVEAGSPAHARIRPGVITVRVEALRCGEWTLAATTTVRVEGPIGRDARPGYAMPSAGAAAHP